MFKFFIGDRGVEPDSCVRVEVDHGRSRFEVVLASGGQVGLGTCRLGGLGMCFGQLCARRSSRNTRVDVVGRLKFWVVEGSGGRGGLGDRQHGCLESGRFGGNSRWSARHISEVTWVAEKILCYSIRQSFSTATRAGVNGGSGEMTDTMSLSSSCVDNTGVVPPVLVFDAVLNVRFAAVVACDDEVT